MKNFQPVNRRRVRLASRLPRTGSVTPTCMALTVTAQTASSRYVVPIRPLDDGMQRLDRHVQGEMRANQAFAAHHAYLHAGMARHHRHQRDEALAGKGHATGRSAGRAENFAEHQIERLGNDQQPHSMGRGGNSMRLLLAKIVSPVF